MTSLLIPGRPGGHITYKTNRKKEAIKQVLPSIRPTALPSTNQSNHIADHTQWPASLTASFSSTHPHLMSEPNKDMCENSEKMSTETELLCLEVWVPTPLSCVQAPLCNTGAHVWGWGAKLRPRQHQLRLRAKPKAPPSTLPLKAEPPTGLTPK